MKKIQYIAPEIDVMNIGPTQMCTGSDVVDIEKAQETDPDYYVEDNDYID